MRALLVVVSLALAPLVVPGVPGASSAARAQDVDDDLDAEAQDGEWVERVGSSEGHGDLLVAVGIAGSVLVLSGVVVAYERSRGSGRAGRVD
jgi:hypothetical protein